MFQLRDGPTYYQVATDISQTAFIALFMLVSATMFHISQSMALIHRTQSYQVSASGSSSRLSSFFQDERNARRNIKVYNAVLLSLVSAFLGIFLFIFFWARDVESKLLLFLDMGFRACFLLIYFCTVIVLFRRLRQFPIGMMQKEVSSIKVQFVAFMFGFSVQAVYVAFLIQELESSFAFECTKTVVQVVSFLVPITVILFAHYKTFREVSKIADNREKVAEELDDTSLMDRSQTVFLQRNRIISTQLSASDSNFNHLDVNEASSQPTYLKSGSKHQSQETLLGLPETNRAQN